MGRIITQVKISNFTDATKNIEIDALVDTGASYLKQVRESFTV
jgi:hypothetical protein